MSQLQDNLNEILRQKNAYLLPANLRAGVTLLGVEGNMQADKPDQTKNVTPTTSAQQVVADTGYELAAVNVAAVTSAIDANIVAGNIKNGVSILGVTGNFTGTSKCKVFNSVTDMNSSVGNTDGDIAIIYGINPVTPNTTVFNANVLILAETCPADVVIPNNALSVVNGTYSLYLHPIGDSLTDVYLDSDFGGGGESYVLWSRASGSTGDYTTRHTDFGNIVYLNNIGLDYYGPQTITSLKISDPSASIWNYIKFGNISTMEVYIYNGKTSTWNIAKSELNTDASKVLSGTTVLGGNGLLTGTLDLSSTKKLQMIPIYTRAAFSDTQSDMSITAPNSYAMIDVTTFPQGLGDKRWVLMYCSLDMMGGSPDYFYKLCILPEDKRILYHVPYDTYERLIGNIPDRTHDYQTELQYYSLQGMTVRKTPNIRELSLLTPATAISSTSQTDSHISTYSGAGGLTTVIWMATNAEIRDTSENILRPVGPQASDYYTNQSYTNIFGETVVGTKALPTMTNAEINTAVDTSNEILNPPHTTLAEVETMFNTSSNSNVSSFVTNYLEEFNDIIYGDTSLITGDMPANSIQELVFVGGTKLDTLANGDQVPMYGTILKVRTANLNTLLNLNMVNVEYTDGNTSHSTGGMSEWYTLDTDGDYTYVLNTLILHTYVIDTMTDYNITYFNEMM